MRLRTIALAAMVVLALAATGAVADQLINSSDIKNGTIKKKDLSKKVKAALNDTAPGAPGTPGQDGANGAPGQDGANGAPGEDAQTPVDALPGQGFGVSNSSVSLTPDGVEFGPYADGGADGGSLRFDGLNGQPLSAIQSLVYVGRYTSVGDTGGVGVPYLRVFLDGDTHDAIFSPNTQPPDPDVAEGPFHTWVATSGLWRYDDDAGSGGQYGVNGAPFATVVGDHGTETISGIYITTGFTAGTNLSALVRSLEVNGDTFNFGG
jgi:hypothetical protein